MMRLAFCFMQVPLNIKNINTPAEELGVDKHCHMRFGDHAHGHCLGYRWRAFAELKIVLRGVMLANWSTKTERFLLDGFYHPVGSCDAHCSFLRGFGGENTTSKSF